MNVQEFFKKYQRYIVIILIALFFIKSFQSCNRNMTVNKLNIEITHLSDSLNNMMNNETGLLMIQLQEAKDSIKSLNYEVKLATFSAVEANKRANAVQSTAEKMRKNTTIKIENNNRNDTISSINK